MAATLRVAVRPYLSFSPASPKFPSVRSLHMTGSNAQPSTSLAFQSRVAELRQTEPSASKPAASSRPFNTTRALQKPNDSSPIDLAYFPSIAREEAPSSYIGMIPLLPDTVTTSRASNPHLMNAEPVAKPEISTASAAGEGIISALGESEGGTSADSIGLVDFVKETAKSEVNGVRKVWNGFVDDLLGPKKHAH